MLHLLSISLSVYVWILTVGLSPEVRGLLHVIGVSEPVTARVGGDAVLPCHCDPGVDLTPLTVEWSRAELRPHPSDRLKRVRFVHVYTDHRDDDPDMKIPEFANRTRLFPEQLPAGVASLRISDVTLSDNGTYRCFIPNLQTDRSLQWTQVTLRVEASDDDDDDDDDHAAPTQTPDLTPRWPSSEDGGKTRSVAPKAVSFIILVMGFFIVSTFHYCCRNPENQSTKEG